MHKQQRKLASRITQQPLRGQSEKSSPAPNCKQLSLWHQGQDQDLQLANAGRAKSKRHTSDSLPDFVIQLGCQACALRSSDQEHRPNNSFKPSPLRGLGAKPVRLGRAGLTQALGVEMPFRSRARRKHLRARACSSVSDLASCDRGIRSSPSGLSLRQVPAGRIARSCVHPHRPRPMLLRQAGRALRFRPCGNQVLSGNLAPNNSFKPSPLRGLVAVSLAGRGPA